MVDLEYGLLLHPILFLFPSTCTVLHLDPIIWKLDSKVPPF
ncbi:hypothetical protein LINPERHAP1_LOCUS18164 [Linum perenne]